MATTLVAASHPASAQDASPVAGASRQTATVSVSGVGIVTVTPDTASVQLRRDRHTGNTCRCPKPGVHPDGGRHRRADRSRYRGEGHPDLDVLRIGCPELRYQWQPVGRHQLPGAKHGQCGDSRYRQGWNDLLDGAVAAGANTIYGVNFYLDDSTAASSQARALAVQDAQKRAQELAEAAGMTLGPVVSISEGYSSSPGYGQGGGAMGEVQSGGPATPIQAGTSTVEVDVTVTYQLI